MDNLLAWGGLGLIAVTSMSVLVASTRHSRTLAAERAIKECFTDGRGLESVVFYAYPGEKWNDRLVFVFADGHVRGVVRGERSLGILKLPISDKLANFSFAEIVRGAKRLLPDPVDKSIKGGNRPQWRLYFGPAWPTEA